MYDAGTLEEPSVHICRSIDSTMDLKYSLNVLAISLFLKIISSFLFNTMSVSALLCLFKNQGLYFTQKSFLPWLKSKLLKYSSLAFLFNCTI